MAREGLLDWPRVRIVQYPLYTGGSVFARAFPVTIGHLGTRPGSTSAGTRTPRETAGGDEAGPGLVDRLERAGAEPVGDGPACPCRRPSRRARPSRAPGTGER